MSTTSSTTHKITYPIHHGIIDDWDTMEHLWQTYLYDKLRCNPQDHYVLLTEPPLNTPENRERTPEIMFETFNVPGMCISVQAVLALTAASWTTSGSMAGDHGVLTGTVVDSGYGSTHIVLISDGHVMSCGIEHIDVGGRDVTAYVQDLMRERKEPIQIQQSTKILIIQ